MLCACWKQATSQRRYTALIGAARNGQLDTVRLLLDRGADIEAKNNVSRRLNSVSTASWAAPTVSGGLGPCWVGSCRVVLGASADARSGVSMWLMSIICCG